jgi:membrane protein DedA with SNARE-associated domain
VLPTWGNLLFYVGLGLLLTAEEAGIFLLPGDISIIGAGVYAAQGGDFILYSWIVAAGGMIAGACIMFFWVRSHEGSTRAMPERVRNLVLTYGSWGIAGARLVPGLRNATVFAAGAAGLSWRRFLIGLIPAAIIWSGLLLWIGWFGGDAIVATYHKLEGRRLVRFVSFGLVAAAFSFWISRLWLTRKRHTPEVEPARPSRVIGQQDVS